MARSITSDFRNAITSGSFRPCFLFEAVFGGDTYRWWTGNRNLSWNSQTWGGNGYILNIGAIEETEDLSFSGTVVELAGDLSILISLLLNNSFTGQSGKVYFGLLDSSNNIINAPYEIFSGFLDNVEIKKTGQSGSIQLTYENDLTLLRRSSDFKFTSATQKIFYPDDLGFEYVPQMANWNGYWGKPEKPKKRNRSGRGAAR